MPPSFGVGRRGLSVLVQSHRHGANWGSRAELRDSYGCNAKCRHIDPSKKRVVASANLARQAAHHPHCWLAGTTERRAVAKAERALAGMSANLLLLDVRLPCPALPCPALPCPALPCPALASPRQSVLAVSCALALARSLPCAPAHHAGHSGRCSLSLHEDESKGGRTHHAGREVSDEERRSCWRGCPRAKIPLTYRWLR